jgi:hypothetical protein
LARLPFLTAELPAKPAILLGRRAAYPLQSREIHKEMTQMKKLVMLAFVAALAVGCSKKKASCEDVYAHTLSLAPPEMREMFEKNKEGALKKCEKLSEEARSCAMAAKTMADLQKCPRE